MIHVVEPKEKRPAPHTKDLKAKIDKLHEKNEEEYAARKAQKMNLPYADLHIVPLSSDDIFVLPQETAEALNMIVFQKKGRKIKLGTPTPEDAKLQEHVAILSEKKGWEVELFVISPSSFSRGIDQYKHVYFVDALSSMKLTLSGDDLAAFEEGLGKLLTLKDRVDALSTTEILEIIFSGAIKLEASDIHIEPQREMIRLRYRIDGVLQDIVKIPYKPYKTVLARIKLMGKMKINIRDRAQDGRFSFTVDGAQTDIRVSTIPSKNAEGIVMRLLSNAGINSGMNELGLVGKAYEDVQKSVTKNDGIILTTGPTGSGKTTTLYTIIQHINSPDTKVITIEDPIEYEVDGIVQTEISKDQKFTFAKALRAIVRQDPDIILVGEIRDNETADIAINAALTGHLVLSTLHTNNAPATVSRLMELGVRPTLIPPAAEIFIAQRLVRKLCSCKTKHKPTKDTLETILRMVTLISPKAKVKIPTEIEEIYTPNGCEKCHNTGYKGRIGIFEVLSIDDTIEKLIIEMSGETEITKAAIEAGFITMAQDGILKALQGVTSMEEIWRVTSEMGIIEELYDNLMSQSLSRRLYVDLETQAAALTNSTSLEKISESVAQAGDEGLLAFLFSYGVILRSSDIHIEPQEHEVHIRMRIDGVLQTVATIPLTLYPIVLGQIKNLSNIPTTIRQGVSDSRFGVAYEKENEEENRMDIRVSIILGGFGETVVMRLLNRDEVELNINTLGINPYNMNRIMLASQKPYGMVLNTGPTGSGKTTTLYSILNELNDSAVKIITIEDPIEYQLNGILQTQINKKEDYTFDKALRALLRQDPDIILVGEIRDEETAETAVNASLTGHLLISTLHTNSAIGAVQRLLNLGVREEDITTSVNAIIAQRLVRKLCSCKKAREANEQEKALMQKTVAAISSLVTIDRPEDFATIYEPGSCKICNGIGFKGRTVVSEVFTLDNDLKTMIARRALIPELETKAIENGMLTMEQDGILKALAGDTTLEEVRRVTML